MAGAVEALAVKLTGDTGDFDKKIGAADQKWSGFTAGLDGAGKKMKGVGTAMSLGVTAPLVGLGAAAVTTVAKFDDSMSKVQAVTGATSEDLGSMRDLAKDLGSTTAFSASQAADAMGFLGLAGFDTNQILEATPQMLALASAGGLDLARAADIASDTLSAFGLSAEESGRVADVFAATSAKSNTSVEQLGETMKFAAPVANAFGASIEQTSAIAGRMADSGIKASQAGTSLRAGFLRLASPTEDAASTLEQLGVETTEADGSMRNILLILRDMEGGMADMSEEAKISAMQSIFGTNAMAGWMAVMNGGTDSLIDFTQEIHDSNGAAADMAETMQDNVGGSFRQLKSQTEGILIQLGEQLAPIIKDTIVPLIQSFGDKLSKLIDWFSNLDSDTQKWILTAVGIVVAMGPLLIIVGTVASAIAALIPVVGAIGGALALLTGPIGLIVLAVAGLALAWQTDFLGIQTKTKEFWSWLTGQWPGWTDSLKQGWETFSNWWSSDTETKVSSVRGALQTWADGEQQRFGALTENLRGVWSGFTNWWQSDTNSATNTVRGVFQTQTDAIRGVMQASMQFMRGDWEGGMNTLRDTSQRLMDNMQGVFRSATDAIAGIFRMFGWEGTGEDIVRGIQRGVERGMQWVRDAARRVAQAALNAAKSVLGISSPSKVFEDEVGGEIDAGMARGVDRNMPAATRTIESALNDMIGGIPSMADAMPAMAGQGAGSGIHLTVRVEGRDATFENGRQVGKGIMAELRSQGLR